MIKESDLIKRKLIRTIGFAYLLLGTIVLLNSFPSLTGFVIYEDIPAQAGGILGFVFIVVGIFVLMSSWSESRSLGKREDIKFKYSQ